MSRGVEPGDDRLGVAEQSRPASVSETARGPPGRSSRRSPTSRSRVWICWLIADCV